MRQGFSERRKWGMNYGPWWAIQWNLSRTISLGIHIDFSSHKTGSGIIYGPYMDLHLPCLILSVGRNPIYSGEIELLSGYSRGGLNGNNNYCGR